MTKTFKRIIWGFKSFFVAVRYINKNRLGQYIVLPGMASLFTISLIIVLYFYIANNLFETLLNSINSFEFIQYTKTFLNEWASFLLWILDISFILIEISLAVFSTILTYRIIIPIVILPFIGPLLNRIEQIELGQEITTTWKEDFANALRSIYIAIRSGIYGLLFLFLGLCLGPLDILVNLIYQSYALGRSSFDAIFEKKYAKLKSRDLIVEKWKWEIFGNGLAYFLFLLIPVIGVIFAPVVSLVGSALIYYRSDEFKQNK